MVRSGLFVSIAAAALAVAGCGSRPPITATSGARGTRTGGAAGSEVAVRPLRNGETFSYALGARVGGLGTLTDEYLTVRVARATDGGLIFHYTNTHVYARRRTRTERQFGLRSEKSLRIRTAAHRYGQDATGTLRWNGPVDGGYLGASLVEGCLIPEIRSPFAVGRDYDSGPTTFHNPQTGASTTTGRVRYRVAGVEEVRVPAGAFEAVRVEFEVTRDGDAEPASVHRWTDWYHQERWLVKRQETSPGLKILGRETQFTETMELLEKPPHFPESWKRESS